MVSTIRYSANASSDHHPNQVPGILIIINPKQPNLPTCSVTSTYLLFHLLSNPSLHLIANTTLGIIMTAIKISPKTLNHSILSTITNWYVNNRCQDREKNSLPSIDSCPFLWTAHRFLPIEQNRVTPDDTVWSFNRFPSSWFYQRIYALETDSIIYSK